jgi:peptide deformylase
MQMFRLAALCIFIMGCATNMATDSLKTPAKDESKVFTVIRMGHPTLSMRAKEVTNPKDPEVKKIVDKMIATCESFGNAAGLAATQVNITKRIFVFKHSEEQPFEPIINPVIEPIGTETELGWEGCFSLPGLIGEVPRYKKIRYSFQTLEGKTVTREVDGFHARVVQHETDHLDGKLYVERMKDMHRFGYLEEAKQYLVKPNQPVEE